MNTHDRLPCDHANYKDGALRREHEAYIRANLDVLDERYHKAALNPDPKALYELMGEDCRSASEERRIKGFTALYNSVIVLHQDEIDRLNERTTHRQDWEKGDGKDQRYVKGSTDIVTEVLKQIVEKGALVGTDKHPKAYFLRALKRWKINAHRRPYEITTLDEKGWREVDESIAAPSAEEKAMEELSVDELGRELIQEEVMTEQQWLISKLRYVEEMQSKEVAALLRKTEGTVRNAETERNRRVTLQRDRCLAVAITAFEYNELHFEMRDEQLVTSTEYYSTEIDLIGHAEARVNEIRNSLREALEKSVSFTGYDPVFLPLTSGIGEQPGRLYLFTGSEEYGLDCLRKHLLQQGVMNQTSYFMVSYPLNRCSEEAVIGFHPLDKIVRKVQEHGLWQADAAFIECDDKTDCTAKTTRDISPFLFRPRLNERNTKKAYWKEKDKQERTPKLGVLCFNKNANKMPRSTWEKTALGDFTSSLGNFLHILPFIAARYFRLAWPPEDKSEWSEWSEWGEAYKRGFMSPPPYSMNPWFEFLYRDDPYAAFKLDMRPYTRPVPADFYDGIP